MVSSQAQQQLYTHAAEPKAVQQRKAKYRDEEPSFPSVSNIMYDRRVVRGNTYAARILPADATLATTTDLKKTPSGTTKRRSARQAPPRTPDAVEGRRHIDIQTDVYLEELTDTVPEADNGTQTDAFLDRPPTPLFVPQKTGIDATTQIENGDLFDFDFEVEPILEVLVGKVLEQGLMEVLEEEELAAMHSHQEHFEQIRNAELVATQRMEAAEMRRLEEKERRLAQERDRLEREKVVRQKVAATTFARGYLSGIVNSVFDQLQASGYFYDPVLREVEVQFMPWLQEQAVGYLAQGVAARKVVQQLVADAAAQLQRNRDDAAARQHARIVAAEEAAVRERLAAEADDGEVLTAIKAMATFVLSELKPAVTTPEAVEAARAELVVAAEAASLAKWEEAKAVAGETARADAEAKLEAQRAQLEEMAAKAAEDAAEAGEEPPPPPTELPDGEAMVDVEAVVAAAIAAVEQEPVKEVTDNDVLSHMLEKGVITKDGIVHSMAVDSLGDEAYTRHPLFVEPVAPA